MQDHPKKTRNLTAEQYQELIASRKVRQKYGNHKVEYEGNIFDSAGELAYYHELKLRQRTGEIEGLGRQVEIRCIICGIWCWSLEVDFVYTVAATKEKFFDDYKGAPHTLTRDFKSRWRVLHAIYGRSWVFKITYSDGGVMIMPHPDKLQGPYVPRKKVERLKATKAALGVGDVHPPKEQLRSIRWAGSSRILGPRSFKRGRVPGVFRDEGS